MILVLGGSVWDQYRQFLRVEIIEIDPLCTLYKGAGNSVVLTTEDGATALVVDTKTGSAAEFLRKNVTARNVIIVNTHSHPDHTGGNALFPEATVIAGAYGKEQWDSDSGGAAYPSRTVEIGEEVAIPVGNETVIIRNTGRGHTQNDTVVYLKNRKLLVTGDLVFIEMHPAMIEESGTKVSNWINSLDDLHARFDTNILVPGHGPKSDRNALQVMKAYFTSINDAIDVPEKLNTLKKKYEHYETIPFMLNFDATVSFIKNEIERE
jgi:cyclase